MRVHRIHEKVVEDVTRYKPDKDEYTEGNIAGRLVAKVFEYFCGLRKVNTVRLDVTENSALTGRRISTTSIAHRTAVPTRV